MVSEVFTSRCLEEKMRCALAKYLHQMRSRLQERESSRYQGVTRRELDYLLSHRLLLRSLPKHDLSFFDVTYDRLEERCKDLF